MSLFVNQNRSDWNLDPDRFYVHSIYVRHFMSFRSVALTRTGRDIMKGDEYLRSTLNPRNRMFYGYNLPIPY